MAQQEEKGPLEPGDAVAIGDILAYLFDDHVRGQVVGADLHAVGAQKAALEDILGGAIELQLSPLVGSQQVDEAPRRGGLVGMHGMDSADGDAFAALDALVADGGEVEFLGLAHRCSLLRFFANVSKRV